MEARIQAGVGGQQVNLMNPGLGHLRPYPFEKLAALKREGTAARKAEIDLSLGEPKHETPGFILEALAENLGLASVYPSTRGLEALRGAIAQWLTQRFSLPAGSLDERHVLPVNGTREALFAIAQCLVNRAAPAPLVLMPNPFYQIYEGAALLAGAEPRPVNADAADDLQGFAALREDTWARCELLYLCSPNNPTGAVLSVNALEKLLDCADRHDFVIAADECYSEIYPDEDQPPPGLLEAAARSGRDDYRRCLAFHSLSKRSNAPGLRSGFVAGDAKLIEAFYRYRTYHGCAMPLPAQRASIAAWQDEAHVRENRRQYRRKFAAVLEILQPVMEVEQPEAAFYLWPRTSMNDIDFARRLYQQQGVIALPGRFLSRAVAGRDPGANRVRLALTPPLAECVEAAQRIVEFINDEGANNL